MAAEHTTARGRERITMAGKPPASRDGWSPRWPSMGSSGKVSRKPRRQRRDPSMIVQSWAGIAVAHIARGTVPELSQEPCTYKVGDAGYTDSLMDALAYKAVIAHHGAHIDVEDTRR